MDNQHRQIKGYRELSQVEIDLMNEIKTLGPVLQTLCDKIDAHIRSQRVAAYPGHDQGATSEEMQRLDAADPEKWLRWGREGMQANLMYLTRAVAQPTFF